MSEIRLSSLSKSFEETRAVDCVDLEIREGELMTLLGPSGSGKTTVLRLIAGFEQPDSGSIHIGSERVHQLPPERRDIGMVFQSYALFPHRNVARNISFGLERRRRPKTECDQRVAEVLELVRLSGLGARRVHELSGGQQQRVALARALVIQPAVLLLDEPLSNLDAQLRQELRREIQRIHDELSITTVLVTHDQEEALTISDRIALMQDGRLQQVGSPDALYNHPANRFVASFVGKINLLSAQRVATGAEHDQYRLASGELVYAPSGPPVAALGIRPEAIRPATDNPGDKLNRVRAQFVSRTFLGPMTELLFALGDGTTLEARGTTLEEWNAQPGATVELTWAVDATHRIEDETAIPETSNEPS